MGAASAVDYFWDPDADSANNDPLSGAGLGGTGTWDTTSTAWANPPGADVRWPNTTPNADRAIFTGTVGVVSLGSPQINVNAIEFRAGGYTIDNGGDVTRVLVLDGTAPGVTVTNPSDTATISTTIGGESGLAMTGAGTLVLFGGNTFSGGVQVNGGTLSISSDINLGAAANAVTLAGGTLSMTAPVISSRAVTLGAGVNTVTVAGDVSVWTGQVGGIGGFTKNGAGSLELGGTMANDFAGVVTINNGTLLLNKTSVNAIGAAGVVVASDSTPGFGPATVRLLASQQIDDNAPVVVDAKNSVAGGAANRALFDLNGFTEKVGPLTMSTTTAGSATVLLGATGRLVLNGDLAFNHNRNAGGNSGRELLISGTGSAGSGGTLDLGGVARIISVNSNFTGANLAGADATIEAPIENGSIVKTGTRGLRLGTANSFSALTINDGMVRPLVDGAIPANIPLTISATTAGTTATLDFAGLSYTANGLTLGGGAGANTIATGAGTLTLATPFVYSAANDPQTSTITGNLNLNGVQDIWNIADSVATATELVVNAVISGSSSGLTKTGAGTLALGAANAFTGPVVVNAGTLALRAQNSVPSGPQVNAGATLLFDTGLANIAEFNNILGAAGNGISVDGGTIRAAMQTTGTVDRTLTNRLVTVGAGGVTFDVSGAYTDFNEGILSQLRFAGASLSGSGAVTKNGGGRLQFQTANPNFSGPVILNNGTLEAGGAALGNSAALNTITVNGGNWAVTGDSTQPLVTLNGGAISTNGANRIVSGNVNVTAGSHVFLNNFWTDAASGWTLTFNGVVSGDDPLRIAVNRPSYDNNSGALILRNAANDYSGTITVQKNLKLEGNSASGVGKTIGTAAIVLEGGTLRLRDNGVGSNGLLAYGNDVTVTDPAGGGDLAGIATLDVNRSTGTNTGNTFRLGALTLGGQQLDVIGGSGYGVEFAGLTTFTGSPTLNVSTATLTLGGGLSAAGQTFLKTGPGTLRILGAATLAGYTLSGGTLEINAEPDGAGRTLALPLGIGFGAGYAATQANLIDRVTVDSEGVAALGVNSIFNPDFSAFIAGPNGQRLRLGGTADATLTGTITPQTDNIVRLGGGGGTLTLASVDAVSGTASLDVNTSGTAPGTVVLAAANNFSGTVNVGGGMTLRIGSIASIGTSTTPVVLDNGTLQTAFTGVLARNLTAGAGGAGLDTAGNAVSFTGAIGGTGAFIKSGAGTLTLSSANAGFTGKTTIRGGAIAIGVETELGAVPGAVSADQLRLEGGTLVATQNFTLSANRGVTLGTGGGTFDTGANTLTIGSIVTGANPLVKEGSGTLVLAVDNSFTGATTINAGTLQVSNNIDSNVTVNPGGTLLTTGGNSISDGQTITVNAGGFYDVRASDTIARLVGDGTVTKGTSGAATITLNSATAAAFGGVIQNGAGTLAITKSGSNTVTFTGANSYTGNTVINSGQIRVEGPNGRLSGGGIVSIGDNNGTDESLVIGNTADVIVGPLDRIGDSTQIEFRGSSLLTVNGPDAASAGFIETMGDLDFREGTGILTLVPAAGGQVQLNAANLIREFNNGSGVIRGTNLGGTGADSSRVFFANGATVAVGAGGAGSQASILPFLIGGGSATAAPDTFLRYDPTAGVTLLTAADYEATVTGSAGRNVSVGASQGVASSVAINALRITGGTVSVDPAATLGIGSGAILFTGTGTISGGAIELGRRQGVFLAAGDTTAITGTIDSRITGGAGVAIGDAGNVPHTLVLSGNNGFIGGVIVNNGILRVGNPGALNSSIFNDLALRAGSGNITGATASALQLGGNSVSVVFGGNDRLQGSTRIQNASANGATLTIITNALSDGNDGVLEDGAGGGSLSLIKRGAQQLTLEANDSYTGSTELVGGTLRLRGGAGAISGTSGITIRSGSTLTLRSEGSGNVNGNRIPDAAPVNLHGGNFLFENTADGTQSYSENAGPLRVLAGGTGFTASRAATGRTSNIAFDTLERPNIGAIITFNGTSLGTGTGGADNSRNRISFDGTGPALDDGIVGGWAFYNGGDFASYSLDVDNVTAGDQGSIVAATYDGNATNATQGAWTASSNIRPTEDIVLTGGTTVNSVNLTEGIDLDLSGALLTIDTGGLIVAGATAKAIGNGSITAGSTANSDLVIRVEGATSATTLSALVTNNIGGAIGLTKTGAGRLTLTGANTYSGKTSVVLAQLAISDDAQLGTVPATPTPGHLELFGGTLEVTGTTTLAANRGIRAGGSGGIIDVRGTGNTLTYGGAITADGASPIFIQGERVLAGSTATVATANVSLSEPLTVDGDFSFLLNGTMSLSGPANRIGGGLQFGANFSNATLNYNEPGGSLTLGGINPNGTDVSIGVRSVDSGTTVATLTTGTVNLAGTQDLTIRANNLNLGVITGAGSAGGAEGHLIVGTNSNIMAATQVLISHSPGSGNDTPTPSNIAFGSGMNVVTTPAFTVGGLKGDALVTMATGGTLSLSGFGAAATDLFVGRNNGGTGTTSQGTFDTTGGTFTAALNQLVVGEKSGGTGTNAGAASGTFTVGNAANSITANSVTVGTLSGITSASSNATRGTLNFGGGTFTVANDVSLGFFANNGAFLPTSNGTLNITGGTFTIGGNVVTSNSSQAHATITLDGGTLDMTSGTISVDTFNIRSGTLANVAEILSGDGTTAAALSKTTAGTLRLSGTNAYTGATIINEGVLLISGSLSGTTALTVAPGASIGGVGSINPAASISIPNGSTVAPMLGGIGGTLDTGSIAFEGGIFDLAIASPVSFSQLNVTGSVTLNAPVALTLAIAAPQAENTPFTIINNDASDLVNFGSGAGFVYNGSALGEGDVFLVNDTLGGMQTFRISYAGGTGNDVVLTAIPEPTTAATLLGGLASLLGLQRFRRRNALA